jgi:hypothetical protein
MSIRGIPIAHLLNSGSEQTTTVKNIRIFSKSIHCDRQYKNVGYPE